jgi:hypothetical protein
MKVLFFTDSCEDYLADGVFHGLRTILGKDVVDYPKAERLYRGCPARIREQIRGNGFTLYGLLEDIEINRHNVQHKVRSGFYDVVIFGDIGRQLGAFVQSLPNLTAENTIILDGSDSESPYPYSGWFWRNPRYWFLPRANRFHYFKRELTPRTLHYRTFLTIPESICRMLPYPSNWSPIAFSIPAVKIIKAATTRTQLFPKQIIDPEVAAKVSGATVDPPYSTEEEYYSDLQASRFAITCKRGGWDCLRHYEFAAQGCVLCFRDLDRKPASCAPHGLGADNCIAYRSYEDLIRQISAITAARYEELHRATLEWVERNTTEERARHLLSVLHTAKGKR